MAVRAEGQGREAKAEKLIPAVSGHSFQATESAWKRG